MTRTQQEPNMDVIEDLLKSVGEINKITATLIHENAELTRQLALRPLLNQRASGDGSPIGTEVFYHTGQRFCRFDKDGRRGHVAGDIYLLAQVEVSEVNLINMADGNRWTKALIHHNTAEIPKSLFDEAFAGSTLKPTKWVLVL